jgi:hypothetical protein
MATDCNCGCDNCDGTCAESEFAPVRECVPEMTKPNYALSLDCERRKRRVANKLKSILTSDGDRIEFRDGSETSRIALNLIEKAYSAGLVTIDGSGQLQMVKPENNGKDLAFMRKGNTLGFHELPDNANSFIPTSVETRECGKLAILVCDANGRVKLAHFAGCEESGGLIAVDANGDISCVQQQEIPEAPEPYCKSGFLVPYYLNTPVLSVDKWPGVNYPSNDGLVGVGAGSLGVPNTLPDIDKIKKLIVYTEVGGSCWLSGNYRDWVVKINNEKVNYICTSTDQFNTSTGPGCAGGAAEVAVETGGKTTLDWDIRSNVADDSYWKLRIYVKGAYYQHCEYAHTENPE